MRRAAFLVLTIAAAAGAARADHHMPTSTVEASSAWARATPGAARSGAVFLTLANRGTKARRLVRVVTDAADRAALHTHIMDGAIMRMRKLDGLALAPGESVTLKPGGSHVMLMGLRAPLKAGATFSITLVLASGEKIPVSVTVMKIGAMGPGRSPQGGAMRHR